MTQYDLDVIIQKIQDKSPFEHKDNKKSRPRTLKIIISRLYYSQSYTKEPQATREKVTQLLLDHGQFSKEEIDEIFKQGSRRQTTDYSEEFLNQHPELVKPEGSKDKGAPDNKGIEEEKPEEIKYLFPRYA
ncbi:hypothetical protein MSMTP_3137 [Methanosarcina sp. MTP4]|uniref:hypothetical protein n=1 Tax=Methanosarcina sp. MTP4 TaxID=1434100 RepID=UPI000615C04E|nr:hypothetical protein [Methanosarcina sp. MTP4]AKB26606.1 hypothetical protein MSMTP_3137 [Methanosarcina sp. MTP4]